MGRTIERAYRFRADLEVIDLGSAWSWIHMRKLAWAIFGVTFGAMALFPGCTPEDDEDDRSGNEGVGTDESGDESSSSGAAPSCEARSRAACEPELEAIFDECERVAYVCADSVQYSGYTTAASCNRLDDQLENPYCCKSAEETCAQLDEVDCAQLGGTADCFACAAEHGAPYDENDCSDGGAMCSTNNECCSRCCGPDGTCLE